MAEIGLGSAIGLQGVPKDYTALVANNLLKQQALKAAAEKKREELDAKQKENFDKYKDKIYADPNQYASVLLPKVKNATSGFLGVLNEEYRKNPSNWQNSERLMAAKADLSNNLNRYKNESDFGKTNVALAMSAKDGEADVDVDMVDAFNSGDANRYEKTKVEKGYGENPTYFSPIKQNWYDYVNKMQSPFTTTSDASEKGVFGGTVFDEVTSDKKAELFLINGDEKKKNDLLKSAAEKFVNNADFAILDGEVQKQEVFKEAKKMFVDLQRTNFNKKTSSDTRIKGNSPYSQNKNKIENNNWSFDYYTDDAQGADLINIAQKNVGDTQLYTFAAIGKGVVKGIPRAFQKVSVMVGGKPTSNWLLKLEVPKYKDILDANGITKRVPVAGASTTEWVDYTGVREFVAETGISPVEMELKIDKKGSAVQQKSQPQGDKYISEGTGALKGKKIYQRANGTKYAK